MKIASSTALAVLLVLLDRSREHLSDAFGPHRLLLVLQQQQQWKTFMDGPRNAMTITNRRSIGFPVARFFAALDDDEEEEEDDDDDDDEIDPLEPLANGIDSVSWLPSVKDTKTSTSSSSSEEHPNAELIPLFPLGGIVYTPNSQHTLNIFEPRYREMYTDILMNGTKRFAVSMSHPTKSGTFAQMAVLFELEDLKEVSERTADQIKYICNHRVTGRVQLHRVLNPQDWETRSTYLRAEGTVIDDSGKSSSLPSSSQSDNNNNNNPSIESSSSASSSIVVRDIENPVEQKLLKDAFAELVQLQHELEEDVRFTRASVLTLAVQPGSQKDGLWQTIKLWSSFIDQRLMSRQNELQQDFQEKLQNYLKKEKGLKGELPSAIGFQDLSAELQKEVIDLQKRMAVELQPLVLESTLTMQKILECPDHSARLKLVRHFVQAETKRLSTKKAIQTMFGERSTPGLTKAEANSFQTPNDSESSSSTSIPSEEPVSDVAGDSVRKSTDSTASESFFTDDDAFQ